jgi:hypothetical protein
MHLRKQVARVTRARRPERRVQIASDGVKNPKLSRKPNLNLGLCSELTSSGHRKWGHNMLWYRSGIS